MKITNLVFHPDLKTSRVNRTWKRQLENLGKLAASRDMYRECADFTIDVDREQSMLKAHDRIVVQFPPGSVLLDKPGYTKWLEEFVKNENVTFSWEPTKAVVSESCDLAYCYGTTLLQVAGAPDRIGKYVSIWKKVDGAWRCAIEANNFND